MVEVHYTALQLGMGTQFAPCAHGNREVEGGDLPAFPYDTDVDRVAVRPMNHHQVNQAP